MGDLELSIVLDESNDDEYIVVELSAVGGPGHSRYLCRCYALLSAMM